MKRPLTFADLNRAAPPEGEFGDAVAYLAALLSPVMMRAMDIESAEKDTRFAVAAGITFGLSLAISTSMDQTDAISIARRARKASQENSQK